MSPARLVRIGGFAQAPGASAPPADGAASGEDAPPASDAVACAPTEIARPEPAAARAPAPTAVVPRRYVRYKDEEGTEVSDAVIGEIRFTIYVDGHELVTLMCSPWKLSQLVLGFLYLEGLINGLDDIAVLRVCPEDRLAEVRLAGRPLEVPARKILTSGCTGGTSFGKYLDSLDRFQLDSERRVRPSTVYRLMRQLYERASLYQQAGGVHTSILAEDDGPVVVAEDIGRHNTLDKIQGECLLRALPTANRLLLTSGRISSEMLLKAAVMGVPILGSRTSPTELALTLAERLNITVIGYIRQGSMNVYTHAWRVG